MKLILVRSVTHSRKECKILKARKLLSQSWEMVDFRAENDAKHDGWEA